MLKSVSNSLIVRGILACVVGIVALAWPGVTVLALVVLFAVYAFVGAGLQTLRAFGHATVGPVLGHLLLALVNLAAGVLALAWPLPTTFVLMLIVGAWAVVAGGVEVACGLQGGVAAGERAMSLLGGLAAIVFGVVLFVHPGIGAVALALLFGLFNLVAGAWMLVEGIAMRRTRRNLHSLLRHPKAA